MQQKSDIAVELIPEGTKELFGNAFSQIEHFAQLLCEEGEIRGLIGPREIPRIWSRHICNSTAVEGFIEKNAVVADLGSGAGFPGIVLAVQRPDLQVHIIEPMQRRCEWIKFVVAELNIGNVKIYQQQAHELHGKIKVNFVVSRALAALNKIIPWSIPLLYKTGMLVALKGERAKTEISEAVQKIKEFKIKKPVLKFVQTPGSDILASVVLIKK